MRHQANKGVQPNGEGRGSARASASEESHRLARLDWTLESRRTPLCAPPPLVVGRPLRPSPVSPSGLRPPSLCAPLCAPPPLGLGGLALAPRPSVGRRPARRLLPSPSAPLGCPLWLPGGQGPLPAGQPSRSREQASRRTEQELGAAAALVCLVDFDWI